jgi:hypothetical protein
LMWYFSLIGLKTLLHFSTLTWFCKGVLA